MEETLVYFHLSFASLLSKSLYTFYIPSNLVKKTWKFLLELKNQGSEAEGSGFGGYRSASIYSKKLYLEFLKEKAAMKFAH
ncbi:hypothetical protein D1970_11810 [Mesobacillus zeae]|uniref:Uncharacterized protein n=1 Tax=Mesobacillus zeae TaxID=1917180 RepID=A0A398B3U7_9BACI|nr:hypothetical protein D1970_11810 [Mesobacillus zeae]